MKDYTSFIPGNSPIPDPPQLKYIGIILSVLFSIVLLSLIGFIFFEFTMDMAGVPVEFAPAPIVEFEDDEELENLAETSPLGIASRFRLLSPLAHTKIIGKEVTILCTWRAPKNSSATMPLASMQLWVDDIPVPWDVQFGSNTWFAKLKLEPGEHRFRTPVFEVPFYLENAAEGLDAAPESWKTLFSHQHVDDPKLCGDCHYWIDRPEDLVRPGRGLTIGPWKGSESCMSCHKPEDFEKEHLHKLSAYDDCRLCHVVHGTVEPEKPLLKAPKSRLCKQCHEAP